MFASIVALLKSDEKAKVVLSADHGSIKIQLSFRGSVAMGAVPLAKLTENMLVSQIEMLRSAIGDGEENADGRNVSPPKPS